MKSGSKKKTGLKTVLRVGLVTLTINIYTAVHYVQHTLFTLHNLIHKTWKPDLDLFLFIDFRDT